MAKKKKNKKVDENERLIRQVPDEIVLSSILSCLTIKQLARTRLISRHWNRSLHHISVLNFDNSSAMEKLSIQLLKFCFKYGKLLAHERRSFINCVNHVVDKHVGSTIDQFKVTFDLNNTYQSHIDKWVIWALSKNVKILQLDFTRVSYYHINGSEFNCYALHEPLIKVKGKLLLTSLCLKSVNVTTQVVEQLLEICRSTLENLCIQQSVHLTSIKAYSSLESLKYLKVYDCNNLETINISAPKLLSFTYGSESNSCPSLALHFANAWSLTHVSIEFICMEEDCLVNTLGYLSNYFQQLEYLKLKWLLHSNMKGGISNSWPVLANLKHMELCVNGDGDETLAGWIPLIESCPVLQVLTLRLDCSNLRLYKNVVDRDRHPLLCLKKLEIIGFVGCNVDLDVANFVLENGVALKEVIVRPPRLNSKANLKIPKGALDLKVPPGVKLIFT